MNYEGLISRLIDEGVPGQYIDAVLSAVDDWWDHR